MSEINLITPTNERVITPDLPSGSSETDSLEGENENQREDEMRLSTTMPINLNIKIIPGKNLGFKHYVPVEEMDKEQERESTDSVLTKKHSFDLKNTPFDDSIRLPTTLSVDDVGTVKHLCNGSRSHIFKGTYDNKPVILKILLESAVYDRVAQDEFEHELDLLSRFHHPNILNIYGAGQVQSKLDSRLYRPFFVLESLNGDTLAYHLSKKRSFHTRPFTELRYLRMAREFIDALQYMHNIFHPDCIIIHRDLKPDNIGFTSDGTLKLMDFGLSTYVKRGYSADGTYKLSGCTGSLRYMAPEVALNQKYNEKVDIYGYGLIVYEMITGVTPFSGYSKEKFYRRVVHGLERPPLDIDDYGRDIKMRPLLRDIISKCWESDYKRRPTAEDIYTDLRAMELCASSEESGKSFLKRSYDKVFKKKDTI